MSRTSTGPYAPLLIHPGYHKTGTTWFQRRLFVPEFGYRQIMDHREVFDFLVRPHGLTFDPRSVRQLIQSRRSSADSGLVDVISSEVLSGNPFYGARESDMYARRLAEVAPDGSRIVLTIREQMRMLTAIYMQYVFRGGTARPKTFFSNDPVIGYFAFAPEHFEYHRLVQLYRDLFGEDNVLVTNQETLARYPQRLAQDLAAFAGVAAYWDPKQLVTAPEAPSPPEGVAPLLRRINYFRSGAANSGPLINLGGASALAYRAVGALGRSPNGRSLFKDARPVSQEVVRKFGGRYAPSNRELKVMFGDRLDLARYEL